MATTTDKPAAVSNPCECANWEIVIATGSPVEGGEPEVTTETTGCTATTARVFAPGHDAKLKAMLIRAGAEGLEVRCGRASGLVHATDALSAATRFGFGRMVTAGIERAQAKQAARKERAERRATARPPRQVGARVVSLVPVQPLDALVAGVAEQAPEPKPADEWIEARIKVGRWEYDATIGQDGTARYSNSDGQVKSAAPGKYTRM